MTMNKTDAVCWALAILCAIYIWKLPAVQAAIFAAIYAKMDVINYLSILFK